MASKISASATTFARICVERNILEDTVVKLARVSAPTCI